MAALCEGYLSSAECFTAPQGMARRTAPGLDSLPMEFYLKFWLVLGSNLVDVRNSCFDSCCLSLSQRRVVISLSFKKGERLDPKNWRPISLLNADYKLAVRVVAGRGGAVASWLVNSTPDRAVWVRALAGDMVLCSWTRHLTPTVPLST